MSKNKLNSSNLNPFFTNPLINTTSIPPTSNILKQILSNNLIDNPVPLIPGFEFYNNDNIGSKIINNYYKIKTYIDNLSTTKSFIDDILETNKDEFTKIIIKKENYNINNKANLIFKFNDNINNTFIKNDDFNNFFDKYNNLNNNFNFVKNSSNLPLFIKLFQENYIKQSSNSNTDNYFSKKKTYFNNLFKEYSKIREKLLINYLTETISNPSITYRNSGILSFGNIFNLLKKSKKSSKNNNKNNNKNTINLSKIIIRNNLSNNTDSSFKVGDKVNISSLGTTGTIININFKNKPSKPYRISYVDTTSSNPQINNFNSTQFSKSKDKLKDTLSNKIYLYTLLYNSPLSKDYYVNDYKITINTIYTNLYNSINNIFENNKEPNLYNMMKYCLDIDYNLIKFVFNYVDMILYKKSLSNHYEINNDIIKRINTFANIYPSFVDWYNILIGATSPMDKGTFNINSGVSDYESFYNNMLGNLLI